MVKLTQPIVSASAGVKTNSASIRLITFILKQINIPLFFFYLYLMVIRSKNRCDDSDIINMARKKVWGKLICLLNCLQFLITWYNANCWLCLSLEAWSFSPSQDAAVNWHNWHTNCRPCGRYLKLYGYHFYPFLCINLQSGIKRGKIMSRSRFIRSNMFPACVN